MIALLWILLGIGWQGKVSHDIVKYCRVSTIIDKFRITDCLAGAHLDAHSLQTTMIIISSATIGIVENILASVGGVFEEVDWNFASVIIN